MKWARQKGGSEAKKALIREVLSTGVRGRAGGREWDGRWGGRRGNG